MRPGHLVTTQGVVLGPGLPALAGELAGIYLAGELVVVCRRWRVSCLRNARLGRDGRRRGLARTVGDRPHSIQPAARAD